MPIPSDFPTPSPVDTLSAVPRNLSYWCAQADAVATKLHTLTGHAAYNYLESTCSSFIFTRRKDDVRNKIISISKLQRAIYRCQDKIIELGGMGKEWERAEEVSKDVVRVVRWLEDILCWAMVDIQELITLHNHQKLMYQLEYVGN